MKFARPCLRLPFATIARRVRQIERALPHPLIVVLESRHDARDPIANQIVVLEFPPRNRRGAPSRPAVCTDRRFRKVCRGSRAPLRQACAMRHTIAGSLSRCGDAGSSLPREELMMPIESSVVTNCSPAGLHVAFAAAETRQNQRRSRPVTRCARLSLVETCAVSAAVPQRLRRELGVGRRRKKVPAQRDEDADAPVVHRVNRFDRIEAVVARRTNAKLRVKPRQPALRHPLPNPHRAIALHIRVPAHRTHARAGPADVSAQQQEIHDLLDGRDGVRLLGEPHRPAADRRSATASRSPRPPGFVPATRRSPR